MKISEKILRAELAKRFQQNEGWGFPTWKAFEVAVGLPPKRNTPLVRWTNRRPHGPGNSFWCYPEAFPSLPSFVSGCQDLSNPWRFDRWAATKGSLSVVECRVRKAIFLWPCSAQVGPQWVNKAISHEFGLNLYCDIDPNNYCSAEQFNSCL